MTDEGEALRHGDIVVPRGVERAGGHDVVAGEDRRGDSTAPEQGVEPLLRLQDAFLRVPVRDHDAAFRRRRRADGGQLVPPDPFLAVVGVADGSAQEEDVPVTQVDQVSHRLPHPQFLVHLHRVDVVAGAEGVDDDQGDLLGDMRQESRFIIVGEGIVEDDAVHLPRDEVCEEAALVLDQLLALADADEEELSHLVAAPLDYLDEVHVEMVRDAMGDQSDGLGSPVDEAPRQEVGREFILLDDGFHLGPLRGAHRPVVEDAGYGRYGNARLFGDLDYSHAMRLS